MHTILLRRSTSRSSVVRFPLLHLNKNCDNSNSIIAAMMHATASNASSEGAASAGQVRTESDAFGKIEVDASRYWGAQTQRSLQNFPIGGRESRMPIEIIKGTTIVYSPSRNEHVVNSKCGVIQPASCTVQGATEHNTPCCFQPQLCRHGGPCIPRSSRKTRISADTFSDRTSLLNDAVDFE